MFVCGLVRWWWGYARWAFFLRLVVAAETKQIISSDASLRKCSGNSIKEASERRIGNPAPSYFFLHKMKANLLRRGWRRGAEGSQSSLSIGLHPSEAANAAAAAPRPFHLIWVEWEMAIRAFFFLSFFLFRPFARLSLFTQCWANRKKPSEATERTHIHNRDGK